MTNRNDEIRQANRKALPKFILIVVLGCLVGGALGFSMARFGMDAMADGLFAAGDAFCRAAPWLLVACAVLEPAICLPLYFAGKREADGWDGEDETVSDRVERRLSIALWASSILMICAFLLLAAAFTAGLDVGALSFFLSIAGFLAVMAEAILIQQKQVDLCKRLNPEKQGSVYDVRFQKTWLDSCDEAEKVIIGQCAYKAYTAVTYTCLLLWMVFSLTALFFGTGFLPVLVVCVIWAVSQSVYCYWSIRLSGLGSAPL